MPPDPTLPPETTPAPRHSGQGKWAHWEWGSLRRKNGTMAEQERGQLRIYLGAAAGAGKTFDMLSEGHRRAERGADVVVAYVETHGRPHTAALLDGLEIIPRAAIPYRGGTFEEMDLDAVLARKPEIALVDEFAHTNVPGLRHAKRWEDVEELLAAGIEVISNVNIQHLESLNDVVQKITGVPQRETVPDAMVRAADQVELVDMTPETLRRRMAHGNIYPPEKIDAALTHYFRAGNLAALRELALLWAGRQGRRGPAALPGGARHSRHPGSQGAGGGRAARRPGGRDADPPGGQVGRRRLRHQ